APHGIGDFWSADPRDSPCGAGRHHRVDRRRRRRCDGSSAGPRRGAPDGQRSVYRVGAELPAGTPPWRVVGVEWNVTPPIPADLPLPVWSYDYDITVTSLRTGAGEGEAATGIEWAMEVRGA